MEGRSGVEDDRLTGGSSSFTTHISLNPIVTGAKQKSRQETANDHHVYGNDGVDGDGCRAFPVVGWEQALAVLSPELMFRQALLMQGFV
jgi:hypothetical protein